MSTAAARRQILSELSSSKRGGQRRSGKTIALWVVGAFLGIAILVAAGLALVAFVVYLVVMRRGRGNGDA